MMRHLRAFILSESGVTAVEYGGIAAVMLVFVVTGATSVGNVLTDMWEELSTDLDV